MELEQRRERARIAQRRSRAQRQRDYEGLKARVQSLETALEDLTESCIVFSDAVILALKNENFSTLQDGIKPFLKHVLSVSRETLCNGIAGNDDESEHASNTPKITAGTLSTKAQSQGELTRVQFSPRLTYGLLPSTTQANRAPLDILKYLSPQRYKGFAKALFWNTLVFGHAMLEQPTSPLWEALFFYPLRIYSLTRVRDQILRRVMFKPSDVEVVVPTADIDLDARTSSSSLALEDTEFEARKVRRDHELIVQSMPTVQDDINSYLEAAGVEQYLVSRWGMKIEPSSSPDCLSTSKSRNRGWNIPNAERVISYLASRSRCLGDRVGFPVTAVDEAASGLMNINIR